LQKKVEENPEFTENYLVPNLYPRLVELMNDSFGNYLIQRIIGCVKGGTFKSLLEVILENIVDLSYNPFGTRVVQKLVETLQSKKHIYFLRMAIEPHLVNFMLNPNAYHVILKCISFLPENNIIYIFDILRKNLLDICLNKCGCSSIQKCLDVCSEKQRELFIGKVLKLTNSLIADISGNYVLLYIINMKQPEVIMEILDKIVNSEDLKTLCKSRISSSVLEKCLDYSKEEVRGSFVGKILQMEDLLELVLDPQGYFIVIKILVYAKEEDKKLLINLISFQYSTIIGNVIGVRFLNKLKSTEADLYEEIIKNTAEASGLF